MSLPSTGGNRLDINLARGPWKEDVPCDLIHNSQKFGLKRLKKQTLWEYNRFKFE